MQPLAAVAARVGPPPSGRFLVAVSGGADSAVAAALLEYLVTNQRIRLVHLDHDTVASAELRASAEKLAAVLNVPLITRDLEIGGGSWEAAARDARRNALDAIVESDEWIVTGHHRDDVAETVLGNLIRGAGARGLSSLQGLRDRYWRPLLGLDRPTIRALADELALPYIDDPANSDLRFRRNRLRHEILPALDEIQPGATDALGRAARHLGGDDAALEEPVADVPIRFDGHAWTIPIPLLTTLARAVGSRALAELVRTARPPYGPTSAEADRLWTVVRREVPRTEIAEGFVAVHEGPFLVLFRPADAPTPPAPVQIAVPGEASFGSIDINVRRGPPVRRAHTMLLDAAAVGDDLDIRAAAEGDRIELQSGTKSVRHALAESGVAERLRSRSPVVVAHGKIACVVGVRVAAWARFRATSQDALVLSWRGLVVASSEGADL